MAWRRRVVARVVPRRVALDGVGGFFVRADGERERGGVAVEPRRITATGGTWLCVPPRKPRRPAKAAVEKDEKVEGKSAYFSLFSLFYSTNYVMYWQYTMYSCDVNFVRSVLEKEILVVRERAEHLKTEVYRNSGTGSAL
jgi:hypothetical protein